MRIVLFIVCLLFQLVSYCQVTKNDTLIISFKKGFSLDIVSIYVNKVQVNEKTLFSSPDGFTYEKAIIPYLQDGELEITIFLYECKYVDKIDFVHPKAIPLPSQKEDLTSYTLPRLVTFKITPDKGKFIEVFIKSNAKRFKESRGVDFNYVTKLELDYKQYLSLPIYD